MNAYRKVLAFARTLERELITAQRELEEARRESDKQTEIADAMTNYCGMEKIAILELVEAKQERDTLHSLIVKKDEALKELKITLRDCKTVLEVESFKTWCKSQSKHTGLYEQIEEALSLTPQSILDEVAMEKRKAKALDWLESFKPLMAIGKAPSGMWQVFGAEITGISTITKGAGTTALSAIEAAMNSQQQEKDKGKEQE